MLTFQPEYIPYSIYYYAFAVVGHPDEIIVSPRHPDYQSGSSEHWQPKGRPSGMYVFVLNLKSEKVSLMAVDRFLQLEIVTEVFHEELVSAYRVLFLLWGEKNFLKKKPTIMEQFFWKSLIKKGP